METFSIEEFDKDSNYIIEASAGTGKTYSINEIVEKLVLKEQNPVPLSKILIVTYTEKAVGELKNRIRETLKDKYTGDVSIYTIHSFCQNAIKEFGISADSAFGLGVINDDEVKDFLCQYIRKGEILDDIATFNSYSDKPINEDTLLEGFVAGIKDYYLDSTGKEDSSIISLKPSVSAADKNLWLTYNKSNLFGDFLDNYPEAKPFYDNLANSSQSDLSQFADELEEKKLGFTRSRKKVLKDSEDYLYFLDLKNRLEKFSGIKYLLEKYLKDVYLLWQKEKENRKVQSFDDMIRTVRENVMKDDSPLLKKLKEKYSHAIIDEFQDTNQRQYDIFSKIFLSDKEHHIIVVGDAKQSIYSFQGADVNVFKGAIRDIEKNNGKHRMLKKNHRSSKNMVYACNKLFPYFEFDGIPFEESSAIDHSIELDKESEHVAKYEGKDFKPFWVVKASKEEYSANVVTADNFAITAARLVLDCCSYNKDNKTTKLQITRKDDKLTNVSFKDFTILARTRSEMVSIERIFQRLGIPITRYNDQGLFKGKESAHWLSLLEALDVPDFTGHNRAYFKRAMFTNFFGYHLEDLNDPKFEKDDTDEALLFAKWKKIALEKRWEDLFDDIILSSRLTEKTSGLSNNQSFSIYKQIADYCIEYLYDNHTLSDLVRHISLKSKGNKDDEEGDSKSACIEKRTDFDSVQIMTMHASKGLQFPVVISAAGFKQKMSKSASYKFHSLGKPYLTFEKDEGVIPNYDKTNLIDKEQDEEFKRLFYVAYTRAQYLMILPIYSKFGIEFLKGTFDKYLKENPSEYKSIDVLSSNTKYLAWKKEVKNILAQNKKNDEKTEEEERKNHQKELNDLINSKKDKSTCMHSYSSLSHSSLKEHRTDEDDMDKEGVSAIGLADFDTKGVMINTQVDKSKEPILCPVDFPRGTYVGTALHEVFELADFTAFKETIPSDLDDLIISSFTKQGLNRIKDKTEWIAYVRDMVYSVLNAKFTDKNNDTFSLSEISWYDRKSEMEFNFNLLGDKLKQYSNGFIDLLFKRGEYYYVLDWKSDRLNDEDLLSYSDNTEMKKHVDNSYSIQRVLYSYCLIKWLKQCYPDLSEEEIFSSHFGGIFYVFIRGCNKGCGNGIYAQSWNSYSDLKEAFDKIIKEKVGE